MSIQFAGPRGYRYEIQNQGMYSDSTPLVKADIEDIAKNADTIIVKGAGLAEFVTAMFLVDAVRAFDYESSITTLVLPYFPGARQDRVNPTGDILDTARSVAGMINERRFWNVTVLDPHSPICIGATNHSEEYPLEKVVRRVWHGYTGIIAPDKGARARAETFAKSMGKPVYYGEKVRDVSTGRLSGFDIDVPEGGHYLVVDDICDGGGTFIGLGEKIKECGAYADLFVTHGIFSKGVDSLKEYYKNVYTTDSLNKTAGTLVIPVIEDMITYAEEN